MTNQDAISKAISIVTTKTGTIPVYPITRPKTGPNEFIVVNTLGMPSDVLQKGILNVNIHVPDTDRINNKRLNDIAKLVREAFKMYDDASDSTYQIFFKEDFELIIQGVDEHVLNLRFKVFILNNL